MRPFIVQDSDKPFSNTNHIWNTLNTDVLEILPAEFVGLKKEFTIS